MHCNPAGIDLTNEVLDFSMKATEEQRRFLALFNEGESLRAEALAGSGKTTSLRYVVHCGQLHGKALYTSFGKKNIEEAKAKFPADRIAVRTNHSMAFRGFGSRWQSEGRLVGRISPGNLITLMGWSDAKFSPHASARTGAHMVLSTLDFFLQSADASITEDHAYRAIGSRVAAEADVRSFAGTLIALARDVWSRMMMRGDVMPVTHDVYLKAWALTRPQLGFKHILLDEAQDSSDLIIGLLMDQVDCQLCVVGDRNQAIYGWRGAVNAMDAFDTPNNCALTQSFRFGHEIASMANAVLSRYVSNPPSVRGFSEIPSRIGPIAKPFCILARTNSALIGELIHALVASPQAKLAVVGGVDEMVKLVNGAESLMRGERTWVSDLAEFANWNQVVKASEEEAYRHLKQLVEIVTSYGPPALLQFLARVNGNERSEAQCEKVFSTVHKSKGREFPTVKLCDDFADFPSTAEERKRWNPEEGNLLYVAVTRAQLVLDISQCAAACQALDSYCASA